MLAMELVKPLISCRSLPRLRWQAPLLLLALVAGTAVAADQSSSFPAFREGGGSRGVNCPGRRVAHLVPENGRFEPGSQRLIAVLEGDTPQPRPLGVRIAALGDWSLEPEAAGLRLISIPAIDRALLWESFPRCGAESEGAEAPPARTWLEATENPADGPADRRVRQELQRLSRACGTTVTTAPLLQAFGLDHLAAELPAQLPVRCRTLGPALAHRGAP